jgi:TIR domain
VAYLSPDFDFDVFMSYSHGHVPGVKNPQLRRWSQAMIDSLKANIGSLFTEFDKLTIWDDRSLDPTAAITNELRKTVQRSCLLLIVMSPRYLSSAWCTDEVAWFEHEFAERRKGVGRIFIVRAVSTDPNKWPNCLKDERGHTDLGFRFHPETDKENVAPYGWPDLVEQNENFYSSLATLTTTLAGRLQEIKKSLARQTELVTTKIAAGAVRRPPRLYLHARPEHDALRLSVANDLRAVGCKVVTSVAAATGGSLADWAAESRARIEALQHCDALTLLRVSADHGFGDELCDIASDERERINVERNAPLPCAVLDASQAPFPMADFARRKGIELFDLSEPAWQASFKAWANKSCEVVA